MYLYIIYKFVYIKYINSILLYYIYIIYINDIYLLDMGSDPMTRDHLGEGRDAFHIVC